MPRHLHRGGVPVSRQLMRALGAILATGLGSLGLPNAGCSLDNQEGPTVTCADLGCGRINACEEGIIAQCVDGKTVVYHVCSTEEICGADWQNEGQYRCAEDVTDCEGCRPERLGCNDLPGGGGDLGGAPSDGGGGGFPIGGAGGAGGSGG